MSYDGAGNYTPPSPEYPAVAGQLIKSSDFNTVIDDLATALSMDLVRDGRAPMTGDLAMGANKITGMENGADPQDATTVLQVFTSPAFTGHPTAPTQAPLDNSTKLATTAYAEAADQAMLVSPAFTGVPTAPTAAPLNNGTQLATTAYADTAVGVLRTYADGEVSALTAVVAGKAPIASPALTGIPTAPTAATGTSTTQLATTEFVQTAAFNNTLPAQAGNAGKFVQTDGVNASWQPIVIPAVPVNTYMYETAGGF